MINLKIQSYDKESIDSKNSLLLVLFIFSNVITLPIVKISNNTIFFWLFIMSIIVYSLYINKSKFNFKFIIIFITSTIIFLINALLVPFTDRVINDYFMFFRYAILSLFFTMFVREYKSFVKYWYKVSIIGFFILNIYIDYYRSTNGYMDYGTNMTYCFIGFTTYLYSDLCENKFQKLVNLLLIVLSFIQIAIEGNRSSLIVCILILLFYEINKFKKSNSIRNLTRLMFLGSVFLYLLSNIKNILIAMNKYMNSMGVYSYSITRYINMMEGGLVSIVSESAGRDVIAEQAIDLIEKASLMPNGIGYFSFATGVNYPHNIILEIAIDFGIIGIVSLIIISLLILKKYIHIGKNYKLYKYIVAMTFIYSLTRLMFSRRYLTEPLLWVGIGLVVFYKHKKEGHDNDNINTSNFRAERV